MSDSASVTFLFTDIEGSTRLWEQHPEVMAVALNDHNQIVSEILGEYGGRIFKTVGDGFCCAFERPGCGNGRSRGGAGAACASVAA